MGVGTKKMIWTVLLISVLLRLISLNQSLWLDEAINVLAVNNNSLWNLITVYPKVDFHPPGYFAFLWFWTHLTNNYSESIVRLPSLFFGVLTVYITYLIGREIHSKKLGLIGALLVAVNPLHIYYSQEARMYSMAAFGVALNFYYFYRFVRLGKSELFYLLTLPLVFLFDYLTYFVALVYLLVIVMFKRKLFVKWLVLIMPTVFLLLLWGFIFYKQLFEGLQTSENIKAWSEIVGKADLKNLLLVPIKFTIGRISFPNKLIYSMTLLPILSFCAFLVWRARLSFNKSLKLKFVFLGSIPILVPFLISFLVPVFSYFRLLFLIPAYCLVLSFGIISYKRWQIPLLGVIVIFLVSSLVYLFNPKFQREDWKGLIAYNSFDKVINSNGNFAPLEYYIRWPNLVPGIRKDALFQFNIFYGLKNFPAKSETDLADNLGSLLVQFNRIDYMEYLVDVADPNRLVQKKIESLGFKKINTKDFTGIGFLYEYQK